MKEAEILMQKAAEARKQCLNYLSEFNKSVISTNRKPLTEDEFLDILCEIKDEIGDRLSKNDNEELMHKLFMKKVFGSEL